MSQEINFNHICKIEGHAHLTLKIRENKVEKCELKASEGARFFEALVLGKNLEDVQEIVSRICGICSSAHTVCSIQALEEAIKLKPTKMQEFIREMLMIGERIRSHATHLYLLSLPDYYGVSSALELGQKDRDKVNDALEIISVGNKIVEIFGGREMHPFLKVREEYPDFDFSELLDLLKRVKKKVLRTVDLFSRLEYREFNRECDYLSIRGKDYPLTLGRVTSHTGYFVDDDYKKHLKENVKEYATSKFVLKKGVPYMLGAMARINNCSDLLSRESQKLLKKYKKSMGISHFFRNPYHNLFCQALEVLDCFNKGIDLVENAPEKSEPEDFKVRSGHGVSAVEAPRGTLFHEYKIDKEGVVTYCNIITPTAQNLNMMEADISRLVDLMLMKGKKQEDIVQAVEEIIRAYDPCFSCSTHFLKVKWE